MAPRPSVPTVESQRPSGRLMFLDPTNSDETTPSPSDLPSDLTDPLPPLSPQGPDDSRSDSDELLDESDETTSDDLTSSRGSSGRGGITSRAALRRAGRKAVLFAGAAAHTYLARDEASKQVELYVADADDAESIGDPLANIAHRHGGIGGAGNPDFADALAALFGLAGYAMKQFARARYAAELRAEYVAASSVPVDADVPSTPFGS